MQHQLKPVIKTNFEFIEIKEALSILLTKFQLIWESATPPAILYHQHIY